MAAVWESSVGSWSERFPGSMPSGGYDAASTASRTFTKRFYAWLVFLYVLGSWIHNFILSERSKVNSGETACPRAGRSREVSLNHIKYTPPSQRCKKLTSSMIRFDA